MVANIAQHGVHPYSIFRDHVSGQTDDTNVVVAEALRQAHPDFYLTIVEAQGCDLLGWSKAGHAKCEDVKDESSTIKIRKFEPPKSRLSAEAGTLTDKFTFGQHILEYQGVQHYFYTASWVFNLFGERQTHNYLLTPREKLNAEGIPTAAEEVVLVASHWTAELHDEIYVFDRGQWNKDSKLWSDIQTASWDDIILDPALKRTIAADVNNFFDRREVYSAYNVPWKRGVIFHGVPGCGKTATIKALMRMVGSRTPQSVESLYVKSLDVCGMEPSACIGEIFALARRRAPCLLIFEDLDSLVVDKVRSYFLNEVDGLENNDGILMIGSTNHLERLDPGISKRPSRFDRKYCYAIPNEVERIMYCDYWAKKLDSNNSAMPFDSSISQFIATQTEGFSFAYMKELFVQSLFAMIGKTEHDAAENEEVNDISSLADIDVPEDLKQNELVKTLLQQLAVLRQAMADGEDSKKVDEKADEVKEVD